MRWCGSLAGWSNVCSTNSMRRQRSSNDDHDRSEAGPSRVDGAERPIQVYVAAGANLTIAASKFAVAAVTGSSAILSEGIHSLADTGDQLLLLLGIKRSRKPPDKAHPFGYGHEIYFWGFMVAI